MNALLDGLPDVVMALVMLVISVGVGIALFCVSRAVVLAIVRRFRPDAPAPRRERLRLPYGPGGEDPPA